MQTYCITNVKMSNKITKLYTFLLIEKKAHRINFYSIIHVYNATFQYEHLLLRRQKLLHTKR